MAVIAWLSSHGCHRMAVIAIARETLGRFRNDTNSTCGLENPTSQSLLLLYPVNESLKYLATLSSYKNKSLASKTYFCFWHLDSDTVFLERSPSPLPISHKSVKYKEYPHLYRPPLSRSSANTLHFSRRGEFKLLSWN